MLKPVIAVGAHLKNTVAVSTGNRIILSQHIGDLDTTQSMHAFRTVANDLPRLHGIRPESIACDLHPDYLSTQFANEHPLPIDPVQHHVAHVFACMAENELDAPVLGVSWDGTGLGTDGTIWGGEFIRIDERSWVRLGHLHPFALPGGDAAVREPRRCGMSVLDAISDDMHETFEDMAPLKAFSAEERRTILQMIHRPFNSPHTSSAGRLFDAVASLLDIRHVVEYEGQAAMNLEWLATRSAVDSPYAMPVSPASDGSDLDWRPMIREIVGEIRSARPMKDIARRFHASLAEGISRMAQSAGIRQIVLTGGCFQNLLLTEMSIDALLKQGFHVYRHQRIPTNDGGIAAGQAYAAGLIRLIQKNASRVRETA